jgi:hypothetical protein
VGCAGGSRARSEGIAAAGVRARDPRGEGIAAAGVVRVIRGGWGGRDPRQGGERG